MTAYNTVGDGILTAVNEVKDVVTEGFDWIKNNYQSVLDVFEAIYKAFSGTLVGIVKWVPRIFYFLIFMFILSIVMKFIHIFKCPSCK
jgi:ABC-type proline/glycine betaine transport system permease subunit